MFNRRTHLILDRHIYNKILKVNKLIIIECNILFTCYRHVKYYDNPYNFLKSINKFN